ncbi:MAG: pyridoxal-phosphate dependent enzyme [Acidimicrobiia bacterium]|nr:pyridoxal-phosphate dependent enzyme [Acidimicrobiia bacterium]
MTDSSDRSSPSSSPPIPLAEIEAARERLQGLAVRTPLVRYNVATEPIEIYLKLENLQPIGAFKIRGAANAMAVADDEELKSGVWTASAGNMAQGVAWNAARLGVPCIVVVPDHAPRAKLDAIERLGAAIVKVPFAEWWQIIVTHTHPDRSEFFVHPVSDPAVMAGNGTIALELLDDLPDLDAVVVPYGGGGLSSGIASALRHLRPDVPVYAAEVATSAALDAAFTAGEPTEIEYISSFVDGIGSSRVLDEMWPLVSELIARSLVVSLDEVEEAIRLLAIRNRVIAEGAGATAVAAAGKGGAGSGKVACIVSGGNIDVTKLAETLIEDQ